jgi:hypothetical protein
MKNTLATAGTVESRQKYEVVYSQARNAVAQPPTMVNDSIGIEGTHEVHTIKQPRHQ